MRVRLTAGRAAIVEGPNPCDNSYDDDPWSCIAWVAEPRSFAQGGAAYVLPGARLALTDSLVTDCTASGATHNCACTGGPTRAPCVGTLAKGARVRIAAADGGAFYAEHATIEVVGSAITNCSAKGSTARGGVAYALASDVTIRGTTLQDCAVTATGEDVLGGALQSEGGTLVSRHREHPRVTPSSPHPHPIHDPCGHPPTPCLHRPSSTPPSATAPRRYSPLSLSVERLSR